MRSLWDRFQPTDFGLLFMRLPVGAVFMAHGAAKCWTPEKWEGTVGFMQSQGIPYPFESALLATGAELIGGLCLILGLGTRLAGLALFVTMAVAMSVHITPYVQANGWEAFFTQHWEVFFAKNKGYEFAMTLGAVALGLIFTGGGRLSVDGCCYRTSQPTTERGGTSHAAVTEGIKSAGMSKPKAETPPPPPRPTPEKPIGAEITADEIQITEDEPADSEPPETEPAEAESPRE